MKTLNQKYLERLNEFKDTNIQSALGIFREQREIHPMFVAIVPTFEKEKHFELFVVALANLGGENFEQSKNNAAVFMEVFIQEKQPLATCLFSEAWMVQIKDVEQKGGAIAASQGLIPSEHPDRVEVVNLAFESYDMSAHVIFQIKRPPGVEPFLVQVSPEKSEWRKTPEEAKNFRWAALFKKAGIDFPALLTKTFSFSDN
jgi:hypothetical protein